MRRYVILMFFAFILKGCAKVETASNDNKQTNSNKIASVAPMVETEVTLKPVTPKIKLNSKQTKYLNESLPSQVREILEKAEKFEILAEVRGENESDGEGQTFEPTRIVKISTENEKKEILEFFYKDAATNESPANCYTPRHKIHTTYQGKIVDIEICFECAKFYVESPTGKFAGTIVRENRKSEDQLRHLIENQSVEIK